MEREVQVREWPELQLTWHGRSKRRNAKAREGIIAEKGCHLEQNLIAKPPGEAQYVKRINRATYLNVELGTSVLSFFRLPPATHSPEGILRNPNSARTKPIFYRRICKKPP